jgi:hypothetical protein
VNVIQATILLIMLQEGGAELSFSWRACNSASSYTDLAYHICVIFSLRGSLVGKFVLILASISNLATRFVILRWL